MTKTMVFVNHKKTLTHLPFLLALVFVGLVSVQAVNNADIWFHLKIGEQIVRTRTFPQVDFMSHTAEGREWIVYSWAYDILVFLIKTHLGVLGLTFLRFGLAIALLITLWKTSKILMELHKQSPPIPQSPKEKSQALKKSPEPGSEEPASPARFAESRRAGGFGLFSLAGSGDLITAVVTTFSFYVISIAWIDRPHLLGSLFIAVLMLILTLYRQGKERYSYFIPPLLTLWSNTHASLPIAIVIMILLLGSETLENLLRARNKNGVADSDEVEVADLSAMSIASKLATSERSEVADLSAINIASKLATSSQPFNFKLLTAIIPLSFLASLLNPYHLKIYQYFFKINSIVTENIFEWLPLSQFFADPYVKAFLVFLLLYFGSLVLAFILRPRETSFFEIGLSLILTYMAFSALRHMVIFTLIMSPYLAKNLSKVRPVPSTSRTWKSRIETFIKAALLLALAAALIPPSREVLAGRWGLPDTLLPVEAVEFVEEVKPNGKMYNHFNWGGYLLFRLYPEYKTFIDGRLDMFVPDIYKEWLAVGLGKENWREILEKYDVGWIIFPSEGIWEGLREDLESKKNWCLIFWDDYASVIARSDRNKELCQKYGYQVVTPFSLKAPAHPKNFSQAEEEYLRAISHSPKNAAAHNKLGTLYFLSGKREKAGEEFRKAKEVNPRYASPYYNLGCLTEEKDPQQALSLFETTIKLNPQFAPAYKKLALIYGRRFGNIDKARKYLLKYERIVGDPQEKTWARDEIYRLEHNIHLLDNF